ncbi:phage holin family protein [Nafulsella turpanensis]|uniref:phage holin family protein n=1 Tax=Nafulsella turpanensis TaxID=1265690 RepID=UPI0003453C90|nr:phage holin family protein [Nafulsella turpanensis]
MNFFVKVLISGLAVLLGAYLLPGVAVDNFITALVVALVLALLNSLLKPILVVLTIPVTIITFGLFLLVINAIIILLAEWLIEGFLVDGFWSALLFSFVLSALTWVAESFQDKR